MKTFPDFPLFMLSSCRSALSKKRTTNCIWELTYNCNARCGFCPYWKKSGGKERELNLEEIRIGLKKIYRSGCRFINFSGGEPTLRPDLEEIIESASREGFWTSLVSNGSLLTREKIENLKRAGLDNLFVSLDFVEAEKHDELRNIDGLYGKVIESLSHLGEIFTDGHRTAGIMCVISKFNAACIRELVELSGKLGVFIVFQLHHDKKTGNESFNVEEVSEISRFLLELQKENRHLISSRSYLKKMAEYGGGESPKCFAGEKYFSIDPFGYFHPCIDMPRVGHILKDDISILWSRRAQEEIEKCTGCWYCFRGEADVSFSVSGCLEKVVKYGRVFVHNARKLFGERKAIGQRNDVSQIY